MDSPKEKKSIIYHHHLPVMVPEYNSAGSGLDSLGSKHLPMDVPWVAIVEHCRPSQNQGEVSASLAQDECSSHP